MPIILGLDRHQMSFSSLEDSISADNEVRFIDAFVEKLDLQQLGVQSLTSTEKKKVSFYYILKKYLKFSRKLPQYLAQIMSISKGILLSSKIVLHRQILSFN